jgi:hypothetical protein
MDPKGIDPRKVTLNKIEKKKPNKIDHCKIGG